MEVKNRDCRMLKVFEVLVQANWEMLCEEVESCVYLRVLVNNTVMVWRRYAKQKTNELEH